LVNTNNRATFGRRTRNGDPFVYTGTVNGNRVRLTGTPRDEGGRSGVASLDITFNGSAVLGSGQEAWSITAPNECRIVGSLARAFEGSIAARSQGQPTQPPARPPEVQAADAAINRATGVAPAAPPAPAVDPARVRAEAEARVRAEAQARVAAEAEARRQADAEARATAEREAQTARVREAQEHLRTLGLYTGAIDGQAGRGTRQAIQDWQRASTLPQSGALTDTQAERLAADARRPAPERQALLERARPPAAAPIVTPAPAPVVAAARAPGEAPVAPPVVAAAPVVAPPVVAAPVLPVPTALPPTGKRVALIVGIGRYTATASLANPTNDARALHAALTALGFDSELVLDSERAALERAIRRFSTRLEDAAVALFFYAGHGMQVGAKNFLLPSDVELKHERDLRFEAIDLDLVLDQMESARRINLVFMDACRDNPLARSLARSMGTRSSAVGTGLAAVQTGSGTLIAYATQPGNVAEDGVQRHSPFTAALLEHIKTPGIEVRQMLTRVRASVRQSTNGRQVPWDHSSLENDFYFVPVAAPAAQSVAAPAGVDPTQLDLQFWTATQGLTDREARAAALKAYLEAFPTGRFAAIARIQLSSLGSTP
jgi:uncharacterized caspase-like protein